MPCPPPAHLHLPLPGLQHFLLHESYDLDSASLSRAESDERLEAYLLGPLRNCRVAREVQEGRCDLDVAVKIAVELSRRVADVLMGAVVSGPRRNRFTDWGSMLLSKQSRELQNFLCGLVQDEGDGAAAAAATTRVLDPFVTADRAVAILQLEKPADWLTFRYEVGDDDNDLNVKDIMNLRVDFSSDVVAAVCGSNSVNGKAAMAGR